MSSRLELGWPNKDKFLLVPRDADGKPVWVAPSHPAAHEVRLSTFTGEVGEVGQDPYADNLLFIGDSLDVLRILAEVPECRRHYRGKVKLIYIDPPFNTGQTFTHYDDWMEHSTWLSFMRDRLLLMKELLAPDGSIWVHLDDVEVHRMRCLLDEVLGSANCIADLTVEMNPKGRQLDKFFAGSNDRLLVYAKNRPQVALQTGSRDAVDLADFPKRDAAGRPFRYLPLRNTNKKFNPNTAPTMHYPLHGNPETGRVAADPFDGSQPVLPVFGDLTPAVWRWSAPKVRLQSGELECRYVGSERRVDIFQRDFMGDERTKKLKTIWMSQEVGSTDEAKRELKALQLEGFDTPKPERLLQRVIEVGSRPGDVVFDCFGGSGSTAAVAHKMGRRWVTCEISPDTVKEFTAARLVKVVKGEDTGGISKAVEWTGGGGFRTVEVGPSMYEVLDGDMVLLAEWATNGKFARAVAGQLGFEFEDAAPFCGRRGRMRLAIFDGAVGPEEVRDLVSQLEERERLTIVAQVVLPAAEETLAALSPGSRVKKAPRDLLTPARRRRARTKAEDPS